MVAVSLKNQAQHWTPAPRPKGVARWRAGACYANAYRLSVNREDLQYAEGIAASSQTPPFLHAWCVDQKGCVVDPTLANPEQFSFFGVRFSRADHVLALCQARGKDIINRLAKSDVVVKQYPSRYPYPSIFLTKPPNGQQGTDLD